MLSGKIVHVSDAQGGITAQVEHVEIRGAPFVLKTDSQFDVAGEKLFQAELQKLGLPHIAVYDHVDLRPDQMLMQYIDAKSLNGPNFTNENLAKLGQTLARLHTRAFDRFYALDAQARLRPDTWVQFVATMKNTANKTVLPKVGAKKAVERAAGRLLEQNPRSFVLCHGDVHGNNVFCTDSGIILYDNNADCFVATPHYDLAILFGEVLPGYRYGSENAQGPRDRERMEAFLQGYGSLPEDFDKYIDEYVLLRSLGRYPNHFVARQDAIIELLINQQLSH